MVAQDWDRARWAWFLALFGGVTYFYAVHLGLHGLSISVWKTSGVAFLALWAALNARGTGNYWIVAVLAFGAVGDFLLAEFGFLAGGLSFVIGHFIAITFYLSHRRRKLSFSQKLFAIMLAPLTLVIAWSMARFAPMDLMLPALTYAAIVALMASSAWISRFPRFRTGIGAFAFVVSDLFILAGEGAALPLDCSRMLVWPLYFAGQALIAWGVVSTLSRERVQTFR